MSKAPSSSLPTTKEGKRVTLKSGFRRLVGRSTPSQTSTTSTASSPIVASPVPAQSGSLSPSKTSTANSQIISSPTPAAVHSPSASKATLWDQAVLKVPLPERTAIDFTNLDKLSLLKDVKDLATESLTLCEAKQWKLTLWNGKTLVLRDICGKMVELVDKFAKIGDIAIQYSPAPAQLPWAGFRLLLQFALADAENMGYMLVGLERMAQSIDTCTIYEALYLSGQANGQHVSNAAENHERTIVDLYAVILTFQASAIIFYRTNTAVRGLKAVLDTDKIQAQINAIEKKEDEVRKSAQLVEVENQRVAGKKVNDDLFNYYEELKKHLATLESTLGTELHNITSGVISVKEQQQRAKEELNLAKLPQAEGAAFNSRKNDSRADCLKGTREDLLRAIDQWSANPDAPALFWLSGMAGTGKSTIAKTIAHTYSAQNSSSVVASFFFTRGAGDLSNAGKFISTIASQLANQIPALKSHVSQAIETHPDIFDRNLREQWNLLVVQPLNLLTDVSTTSQIILIVDALDECEVERDTQQLIRFFGSVKNITPIQFRVFLTSRPEQPIRLELMDLPTTERQDIMLHDVEELIIKHDIALYFESEFNKIRVSRHLGNDWPDPEVIDGLVQQADKLFIYATTTIRFIGDPYYTPSERLSLVLKGGGNTTFSLTGTLDDIYEKVLEDSVFGNRHIREKDDLAVRFRDIVGPLVILFDTLNVITFSNLLGKELEIVKVVLGSLHSVLHVPTEELRPLRLIHLSFHDFLVNEKRCTDQHFWIDEKKHHTQMVGRCLAIMSKTLKQDVCHLKKPGTLTKDVPADIVNQYIPTETQYACQYWVMHLIQSSIILQDDDQVHTFLEESLLYWLEALSLMKRVSQSVHMIAALRQIQSLANAPALTVLLTDVNRFILSNRHIIENATLQIYASALVFSPYQSTVRKQNIRQLVPWIRIPPRPSENWSNTLQTLEGHFGWVMAVAFSPDGKVLASASEDKTVKLWDLATGELRDTFEGHSGWVNGVMFSPDGKVLASASSDNTVKLWDLTTGELRDTLEGHSLLVNAIAFSSDDKVLASASSDKTVKLWNLATGELRDTLEGHSGQVKAVAFSPNGNILASASNDKTVKLWDLATGELRDTLVGHSGWVMAVAFSLDGKVLASASEDNTVKLWDLTTGELRNTLVGHSGWVKGVAFSPDGKFLASASEDKTVKLWDPATRELRGTLEGHSSHVNTVAFSPDGKVLASASDDETVKLWDLTTGELRGTLEGHSLLVNAIAFSPDDKVLASASSDNTVKLWNLATGELRDTLVGHLDQVNAVAFSSDVMVLASASDDETIKLWDPVTGELRDTLEGHLDQINAVAFSPDGKVLALGSSDNTVKLWDLVMGELRDTLEGHSGRVMAVAFSPDGKFLASAANDYTIKLWDLTTGELRDTFEDFFDWINAVAFSPDGKVLASASDDEMVKLWDLATRELLQSTEVMRRVYELSFTSDGLHLQTDTCGLLKVKHPEAALQPSNSSPFSFTVSGRLNEWVTCSGHQLLWLPDGYRPYYHVGRGDVLALVTTSGLVKFLEFDLGALEQCLGTDQTAED